MTTATTKATATVAANRDGFLRLLFAEWTKLRSVRRWVIALVAAGIVTVGLSLLASAGGRADYNEHPNFVTGPNGQPVADDFHFVHQPSTGNATITVRVASQQDSDAWAGAGVMIKESTRSGSAYAAILVTPRHGVRMQSNFTTDIAAHADGLPRWLRLTRAGTTITGYTSTDGATWQKVGTVRVHALPTTAEIGLFVSSPPKVIIKRAAGSTSVGEQPTRGLATFDNVTVHGVDASPTSTWRSDDIHGPPQGAAVDPQLNKVGRDAGGMTEADGAFTVTGYGKIGPNAPDDDPVSIALFGVIGGLIVIVAVAVLFITSEYRRGMIRTTLAASPRRGRALAAKAIVVGSTAFVIALFSGAVAFLVCQPVLRGHGFAAPAFPPVSLFDGPALRAVILTAAFVAVLAVLSVGVGTIMRHSAAAITTVLALVLVPVIASAAMPATPALWTMRLTLAGGFATQRAKPPTAALAEPWAMLSPWTGLAVVCAYAAAAMIGAWWLLRRRDA
jgi:regulation of enolase protein 1 (concanavalin A-like superfamily)